MVSKLKSYMNKLMIFFRTLILTRNERRFIKNKVKTVQIYEGSDEEYNKNVLPFWSKYNIKPDKRWFQYFGYNLNKFDPYIIPNDLFYPKILFYLSDIEVGKVVSNKIYAEYILSDAKKPKTIIKHSNKFLVDDNISLIDENKALEILSKYKKVIYKPTNLFGGKGTNVLKLDSNLDESLEFIKSKINSGEEFIVQEFIKQSPQTAKFNPTSVNTIRLITLLIDGKVEVLTAILRVGALGKEVDNYCQGGYTRPLDENGVAGLYIMQNEEIKYEDYNGNKFIPEKIIGFEKVVEVAKKFHPRFLDLRWIGWDFAIDENYEPILVEMNNYAGDDQRVCGPTFGKLTPKVLDEYFGINK